MTILTTSSSAIVNTGSLLLLQRVTVVLGAPLSSEVPGAPVAQKTAPEILTFEQVQRAIERLKQSIKPSLANSLEFEIDQSTGKTLVKILDRETRALVRQIPSEEILTIARALDRLRGRGGLVTHQA